MNDHVAEEVDYILSADEIAGAKLALGHQPHLERLIRIILKSLATMDARIDAMQNGLIDEGVGERLADLRIGLDEARTILERQEERIDVIGSSLQDGIIDAAKAMGHRQ